MVVPYTRRQWPFCATKDRCSTHINDKVGVLHDKVGVLLKRSGARVRNELGTAISLLYSLSHNLYQYFIAVFATTKRETTVGDNNHFL